MKVKAFCSIGNLRGTKEKHIEIEDYELEEMTESEKSEYVEEVVKEWVDSLVEYWWEKE